MTGRAWILGCALCLAGAHGASAQRAGAALRPDTITVGDPAVVAVRVVAAEGYQVIFPDTLDVAGDVENTGPRRLTEDALADGTRQITAYYPVTAWRPGSHALPAIAVQLLSSDGAERTFDVTADPIHVASVLPADTAGIEPRPPKDVIGGERSLAWLWLLALLAVIALAAWLVRRRRRAVGLELVPGVPPRDVALATLERARSGRYVEAGDYKSFYTLVSDALRHYHDAIEPAWGADLTTGELLLRMRADERAPDITPLERVLHTADMVKFARVTVDAEHAWSDLDAARAWVERLDWPPPPPQPAEEMPLQEVA